ncbi:Altered inheritance of mitochondria protein 9 [Paramyrothecium foliicola]|nr:Altered inheritance of mitochondria protein 9 [Paramyrothecium foliicola]
MVRPMQDGLRWKQTLFNLVPEWTREPSTGAIESISRQQLKIHSKDPCRVTFHAAGLFNKVYLVHTAGSCFVMRVTLPVYPQHKTRAEVTTLKWVRETTSVPVPKVFGFDDSNDNEIGFEWILMEYMQGTLARKRWRTMSMDQKVALTKQFAMFQFELSGLEKQESAFTSIGTLDVQKSCLQDNSEAMIAMIKPAPGRLVSHEFFMGDHLGYDIPRGPFRSSHDWLSTLLAIIKRHQTWILETSEDEDDIEDAEAILPVTQTLLDLLPKAFPTYLTSPEPTALYHDDLNLNNILVNDQGQVTAVLDWECVSALPLWMLPRVPKFLDGELREDEPRRDSYRDETIEEAAAEAAKRNDPHDLDNEGKTDLYWIHKMEYETTQLRKVYKAKLKELCPEWAEERTLESDLYEAALQCDGLWMGKAQRWAERTKKGEFVRFEDA